MSTCLYNSPRQLKSSVYAVAVFMKYIQTERVWKHQLVVFAITLLQMLKRPQFVFASDAKENVGLKVHGIMVVVAAGVRKQSCFRVVNKFFFVCLVFVCICLRSCQEVVRSRRRKWVNMREMIVFYETAYALWGRTFNEKCVYLPSHFTCCVYQSRAFIISVFFAHGLWNARTIYKKVTLKDLRLEKQML